MKKFNLTVLILIGFITSCSNLNKDCIEKIKQRVKEDALGVEMNYQNISFQWNDTLIVSEKLSGIKQDFEKRLNAILDLEYYIQDNFETGKIFSKKYLTKERIEQLRNWEKNNRDIPFNKEYEDYYKFAFANRDASAYISELCTQIESTDSLLNNYENIEEGDLQLLENVLWYYNLIDIFNSNDNPNAIWEKVSTEISQLKEINMEIDSLSSLNPDKVIYYKALNIFKIKNPILNGAEQELKQYFLFDNEFNIIGREDF